MSNQPTNSTAKKRFTWFKKKLADAETDSSIEEPSLNPLSETRPDQVESNPETFPTTIESVAETESIPEPQPKPKLLSRLSQGLKRTRENLAGGLANLFLGNKHINDELFEEIETQLLLADVGIEATSNIINKLTEQVSRKLLTDSDALYAALKQLLSELLSPVEIPLEINPAKKPFVILMVGVNGVGKTTTIGKMAKSFQQQGKKVMLAAGDTFRAAAVEQLQIWGQRNDVPVIAQHTGADSASVIYDALQAAAARGIDVLIADTAGRLQNKTHLMEELAKIKRVMQKIDAEAPHESLLVLDGGTGQNAINQTEQFHQAIGLTGLAVSKLDGTAKGGILFALADKFSIPVRYIGVGETIEDLRTFNANDFIQALFGHDTI